jgi:hypothetical protein
MTSPEPFQRALALRAELRLSLRRDKALLDLPSELVLVLPVPLAVRSRVAVEDVVARVRCLSVAPGGM